VRPTSEDPADGSAEGGGEAATGADAEADATDAARGAVGVPDRSRGEAAPPQEDSDSAAVAAAGEGADVPATPPAVEPADGITREELEAMSDRVLEATLLLAGCAGGGGVSISGTVSGPAGPEAGVWVIAETEDLPTPYAKIVVTDEEGRFVLPEMPQATYEVWVRGYGLVDSEPITATPGDELALDAVVAPSPQAAAHYYPAGYWFSLLETPQPDEFPGTGAEGNGISLGIQNQAQWLRLVKSNGCLACHALGTIGTRTIPPEHGTFGSSVDAWAHRITAGQAGGQMGRLPILGTWFITRWTFPLRIIVGVILGAVAVARTGTGGVHHVALVGRGRLPLA
jgi:hypothetical protein